MDFLKIFIIFIPFMFTVKCFRLPTNLIPKLYYLEIKTYLQNEFRFEGQVKIRFKCENQTSKIVLHSRNLTINEKAVTVTDITKGSAIKIIDHSYDLPNNFYIITLEKPLEQNHRYHVTISFKASLTMSMNGYYLSSYEEKGQTKWLAVTKFEPLDARLAFPCFDEPAMKARFRVSLIRQNKFTSISNMPLISSQTLAGGWTRDVYAESVPMSTYLVAYVVSEFVSLSSVMPNNKMFRVWARPAAIEQAKYALEIGPKIIEFFEQYFGVDYVLPKMDFIAVPDFSSGAMENWGLCTYRETTMLYDEKSSPMTSKETVTRVVAHEIAHQWFGNHVTMHFWDNLWLNEGFATYTATLGVAHVQPDWNALEELAIKDILEVFTNDCLKSSRQVSSIIKRASDIQQMFDPITYSKGSFLLRMMSNFLGEDTFRRGVGLYLRKFQFRNANQDDLWSCLEEQTQIDKNLMRLEQNSSVSTATRGTIKQIMDSWTLQIGYPVIKIRRTTSGEKINISQSRYLVDEPEEGNETTSVWWIPLTFANEITTDFENTDPRVWIHERKAEVNELRGKWILFNLNMISLFRVNYDVSDWRALFIALQDKTTRERVPALCRAQIISDALELARSGQLPYDVALDVLKYLKYERDNVPWKAAFACFSFLSRMTRRSKAHEKFVRVIRVLLNPMYSELGQNPFQLHNKSANINPLTPGGEIVEFQPKEETLPKLKYRKQLITWSCSLGVGDCAQTASEIFKSWQQVTNPDKENPIPVEFRRVVYCSGVRLGGQEAWEFCLKRFLAANVAAERENLINALACTKNTNVLERYIDMILEKKSGIRKQDARDVFKAVARGSGFYIALDFLGSRIKELFTYFQPKPSVFGRYFLVIAESMNTEDDLIQLRDFTETYADLLKDASRAIQQAIEIVQLNVRWQSRHLQEVSDWIDKNTASLE